MAALAAADAGATPLVIERDDRAGGSTGMSQGLFCAAGTRAQTAHGMRTTPDIFFADIMAKARGKTDPAIARALADNSAPTLEWLIDGTTCHGNSIRVSAPPTATAASALHGWPGHSGLDMVQLLHARMGDAGIDVLHGNEAGRHLR